MSGMTEQQRRLELRDRLYGENDLSKLELFAGSYINFGYWRSVPANGPLTIEHRVVSEESLYRLVLEALEVQSWRMRSKLVLILSISVSPPT